MMSDENFTAPAGKNLSSQDPFQATPSAMPVKSKIGPWLLCITSVLVFGVLMAWRDETANHWGRALLAGGAFAILGLAMRGVPRPPGFTHRDRRPATNSSE